MKIINVMCTGRIDLAFVIRAFLKGADGVFVGGCYLGECHYVTEGNYDALSNSYITKKLLEHVGVNPNRLRIEWMSASEGTRFAEVMNDFTAQLKEIGALGKAEGIDKNALSLKLEAINKLIPYIKLVERERLRLPVKSEEAYDEFFNSEEVNNLFNELIIDKLTVSQIMLLLQERPFSTREISEFLELNPSEVSKHMNSSSRQGLVRYDSNSKSYALA
jgi:F420-non-reducing hydrogenase iron-sulfur subunit